MKSAKIPVVILPGTQEFRDYIDDYGYCQGMNLSVKTSSDCFKANLTLISDYADFSGQKDMTENDVVDLLNYAYIFMSDYDDGKFTKKFPFMSSIDVYGHTLTSPYRVKLEFEKVAAFAKKQNHYRLIEACERLVKYIDSIDPVHDAMLQFDGM